MKKASIVLFLLWLIAACNPVEEFYDPVVIQETFHSFKGSWHHEDSVTFELEIQNPEANHNIYLDIRHERIYPFRNIWVSTHLQGPGQQNEWNRQELPLATAQGVWRGIEIGDWVFQRVRIHRGKSFEEEGPHQFSVRHIMRDDNLPVHTIGIRVEQGR